MIPILILAAGSSSRMQGRDKLLETIDRVPLLRRTVNSALGTDHPVYVTLPQQPHPRYAVLEGLDFTTIPVRDAALGMSESLKRGIERLPKTETKAVLIVLADLPDLKSFHMLQVIKARQTQPDALVWRGANQAGQPGHPVLLDASLFREISKLKGDNGAQDIVRQVKDQVHLVDTVGEAALTDLDTPMAWDAWRRKRDR